MNVFTGGPVTGPCLADGGMPAETAKGGDAVDGG